MLYTVRNILKTPRKSIATLLGIFFIVFICGFGLIVKTNNEHLLAEIRERTTVTVKVTQKNLESERGKYIYNNHPVLISDIRTAGEFSEVQSYNFTYQTADILRVLDINLDADKLLDGKEEYEFKDAGSLEIFYIIGVRDLSFFSDIGTQFSFDPESKEAEAVISKNIAEFAGIKLGDTVTLGNGYPPLVIKALCEKENNIYVPIGFLESIGKVDQSFNDMSVSCFDVMFRLTNPDEARDFIIRTQQEKVFDNSWFYLEADDSEYKIETSRMKTLGKVTESLILGVLSAGVIVLVCIVVLHTINKLYDMNILRLLGVTSKKVVLLNLYEMLILSLIGILCGNTFTAIICTALGYGYIFDLNICLLSVGIITLCIIAASVTSAIMLRRKAER